jgi:hypothetical protein
MSLLCSLIHIVTIAARSNDSKQCFFSKFSDFKIKCNEIMKLFYCENLTNIYSHWPKEMTNAPLGLNIAKWYFKSEVFWFVAPCSTVVEYGRFGDPCCFYCQYFTLKLQATWILISYYNTTRHHNSKDLGLKH